MKRGVGGGGGETGSETTAGEDVRRLPAEGLGARGGRACLLDHRVLREDPCGEPGWRLPLGGRDFHGFLPGLRPPGITFHAATFRFPNLKSHHVRFST